MRFVHPNIDHLVYVNMVVLCSLFSMWYNMESDWYLVPLGVHAVVKFINSKMLSHCFLTFASLLPGLTDLTFHQYFTVMRILIQMNYGYVPSSLLFVLFIITMSRFSISELNSLRPSFMVSTW